jgi:hypothetical protein
MENAHLRLGRLEYYRNGAKQQTKIWLHVDRFIGDGEQGHLLSAFGLDADVGAVTAAMYEAHSFEIVFPDGAKSKVSFGAKPSCYKGVLKIVGHPRPVRHLLVSSAALVANGTTGTTVLMNYDEDTADIAWSALVSLLRLPAEPRWAVHILGGLERDKKLRSLRGIGCKPAIVQVTRADLMERVGEALKNHVLPFPEKNGPVQWPRLTLEQALRAV